MPLVEANGLTFNTQVLGRREAEASDGERPAVVMLHGLIADNLSSFYYTIANPVAQVADVYLYDLRGHGKTTMPDSGYSVAENVEDLRALLDYWQLERPVHLVGNSFGGVVALAFARTYPERVASLVLVEAHFAVEGWGDEMAGSLELLSAGLDEYMVEAFLSRNVGRKLNRMAKHWGRLIEETTLIADLQAEAVYPDEDLSAIACPTLAIYGAASDILDRAEKLEQHVPACEMHYIDGASHSVLIDFADVVRDLTIDWLAALPERPTPEGSTIR